MIFPFLRFVFVIALVLGSVASSAADAPVPVLPKSCEGLLLNAEAFGFGPSAATAQAMNEVRDHVERIGYIGSGHTLDLQTTLPYDDIFSASLDASDEQIRRQLVSARKRYSHFFTSLDFRFARLARETGFTVGVYDPLTWYWSEVPEELKDFDFYVAQNFFGVSERLRLERKLFPPRVDVIAPLIPKALQPTEAASVRESQTALVNFGGLSNPFIADELLARYARTVLTQIQRTLEKRFGKILFATSVKFMELRPGVQNLTAQGPRDLQRNLQNVAVALMTSGLGNLLEASSAATPTLWLPATNDSQGQQVRRLQARDMIDAALDWEDFSDGPAIDYRRPQNEVMAQIISRMQEFVENPDLQMRFGRALEQKMDALQRVSAENLKIKKIAEDLGSGGAVQLGEKLRAWIAETPDTLPQKRIWRLGGGIRLRLESDDSVALRKIDGNLMEAHLPGAVEVFEDSPSDVQVSIRRSRAKEVRLERADGRVILHVPEALDVAGDVVHLLYGIARVEWLKRGIYPVHAACLGNAVEGYSLVVGASGSGKTTLALAADERDLKIFSGDKTLIRVGPDGGLEAIAGTRQISIRTEDRKRWKHIEPGSIQTAGDRIHFVLRPEAYSAEDHVSIRRVVLLNINDQVNEVNPLSSVSALHRLFPFFLDKAREDVLIAGGAQVFDGSVSSKIKDELAAKLQPALMRIPTLAAKAPVQVLLDVLTPQSQAAVVPAALRPRKILVGICGIGNGHFNRQRPVLRHLVDAGQRVMIFTYGDALAPLRTQYAGLPNVRVVEVANPYMVGNPEGLDFAATARAPQNGANFNFINATAMAAAADWLGVPDLVLSDYEMVSAQYAYAKQSRLVTLDQQSKFLEASLPERLNGTTARDEIERLNLFFPKAELRIATSFFKVAGATRFGQVPTVQFVPPILRDSVVKAKGALLSPAPSLVVYFSAQNFSGEIFASAVAVLERGLPAGATAHIFVPTGQALPPDQARLHFYHHGDRRFDPLLFAAHGVITTAGHTLLSESLYLEKPVYALPLKLYEQQLSAAIIEKNGFGLSQARLSDSGLDQFLLNLSWFAENIRKDQTVLFKEPGNKTVETMIDRLLRQPTSSEQKMDSSKSN